MTGGIAQSVDAQEHARAWEAVQSAFDAAEEHLAGVMADNARWDEAVRNSYGTINADWVRDMWGTTTSDVNYDVMYIVDPAGATLSGYRNGDVTPTGAATYFGDALQKAIASLPGDPRTFAAATTLARTPDGVAAMAIGPITPNSDAVSIPAARPNMLILSHTISAADLARMGRQNGIDGLTLGAATTGNVLNDHWGNPVAAATWQDRHPGEAASRSYDTTALFSLLALILVMLPISAVHFRTMHRLAEGERKAIVDARRDALTGLPNRMALAEHLANRMNGDGAAQTALLYVDLDGFKSVNDTYDHGTGDRLLRAVATGFAALVGGNGTLARLGGDEFAIVIEGKDARPRAEALAHLLLAFVKEPFDIAGRVASVGASIGLAIAEDPGVDAAELMRRADIAMYDAKDHGRNQWRWFNSDLDRVRNEEAAIAAEMRDLIGRGEFEVAYQPIVNSATRRINGVEALARWPQSSVRRLEPERFIPIAEEHGLINDLGNLVLAIACRDVAQWQEIRLSVNVSPVQLNNRNYVKNMERIVTECGLEMHRLEVEFTETVLIHNTQRAKDVIAELHSLGVTVALDDFGTGFASVGYLRAFHFDKVKLDRSLTRSILTNVAAQKVVQGTVLIANGLSAEIIAEGVESEEEAQLMRLSGCHQLQGFYFGLPQAAASIGNMLPHEGMALERATA